jgi:hypothetical protein
MGLHGFRQAVHAVAAFVDHDNGVLVEADHPCRVVGLSGISAADSLDHRDFDLLVDILRTSIPDAKHRGLWTRLDWSTHRHKRHVERLLGSRHDSISQRGLLAPPSRQPTWNEPGDDDTAAPAAQVAILNEGAMWGTIEGCQHQRACGAAVTPQGFFFCEAAAVLASRKRGAEGLPLEPGCWAHDLADYRHQIERWCPECELCVEE